MDRIARNRDKAAFKLLYGRCAPRMKGFLLARGADATTAEEVLQEAMLAMWRRASQFDRTRGTFDAWLFTITRNAWIDHNRRQKNIPLASDSTVSRAVDEGASAESKLDLAMDAEALDTAIGALPAEQAEVVRGTYFRGLSLRQIAEQSALPLGTVKTRARLAMQHLREALFSRRTPPQRTRETGALEETR